MTPHAFTDAAAGEFHMNENVGASPTATWPSQAEPASRPSGLPSHGAWHQHELYGGCDGFGPLWTCSECVGIIACDDGSFLEKDTASRLTRYAAADVVGDFLLAEAERAALEAMGCCSDPKDVADYMWRRLIFSFPGNPWRHEKIARAAQAIEAGTAKTEGLGPQDESAVRQDAPND